MGESLKGNNGWLLAKTLTKDKLEKGITKMLADPRAMEFFQEWVAARGGK